MKQLLGFDSSNALDWHMLELGVFSLGYASSFFFFGGREGPMWVTVLESKKIACVKQNLLVASTLMVDQNKVHVKKLIHSYNKILSILSCTVVVKNIFHDWEYTSSVMYTPGVC